MSQAPTVPFAAVASAQELELLAEVSVGGGNASEIARRILRRLPAEPGRRSYAVCHHRARSNPGRADPPGYLCGSWSLQPSARPQRTRPHVTARQSLQAGLPTHTRAPASSHPCASARLVWQYENGFSFPNPNPNPNPNPDPDPKPNPNSSPNPHQVRWLGRHESPPREYIVATTHMFNGDDIVQSLVTSLENNLTRL